MGAYDKQGNLVRAMGRRRPAAAGSETLTDKESEDAERTEQDPPAEGLEPVDELEMAVRRQEEKEQASKKEEDIELPPETREDLQPFPLNKFFRSQPVLSEELREAIYDFVVKEGKTVPLASITFGVSNERVGAVVRLKQLEKEWIAQVRATLIFMPLLI